MNRLKKIFAVILIAAIVSLYIPGCEGNHEHPSKDHPTTEHPK